MELPWFSRKTCGTLLMSLAYCLSVAAGQAEPSGGAESPQPSPSGEATPPAQADVGVGSVSRGNVQRTGHFVTQGVEQLHGLKWEFVTEAPVTSAPVIVAGVAYLGSHDGHVYAVDIATGKEKWRFKTAGKVASSQAVGGGLVLAGDTDGRVYALDSATGTLKWQHECKGEIWGSPLICDGMVVFGDARRACYALDLETGAVKWSRKVGDGMIMSPAYHSGTLFFGGFGSFQALDASSGQVKWQFSTHDSACNDSPAVANGLVFFVVDNKPARWNGWPSAFLVSLDETTGKVRWMVKPKGKHDYFVGTPAVANGFVYCGAGDGLCAVDIGLGEVKWKYKNAVGAGTSPSVANGIVYFGCRDKSFYALDGSSGSVKWQFDTQDPETVCRVYMRPSTVGGLLSGVVRKVVHKALGISEHTEFWPSPTVADGVVYFGSGKRLIAVH